MSDVYDEVARQGTVLLSGIVGSTAYGLHRGDSDVDRLGIFARPTFDLLGLSEPKESLVINDPSDASFHEARKYVRLLLQCNPTITELLWLESYEVTTPLGEELVSLREHALSASKVRNAYLGYARSQLSRLENRGDGSFSSNTAARSGKHARHMARMLEQGFSIYTTGSFSVRVANPDWYHEFSAAGMEEWKRWFHERGTAFDNATTALPEHPNVAPLEDWLLKVRREMLPQ